MPAGAGRVNQQRREALVPPGHGDVIHVDAALGEDLLRVTVRKGVPQVPGDRQEDDVWREPEPGEH